MEDTNPELERFRNQWREEVTARARGAAQSGDGRPSRPSGPVKIPSKQAISPPPSSVAKITNVHGEEDEEGIDPKTYNNLENKDDSRRLGDGQEERRSSRSDSTKPRSALEHYEKAVERESQGNLGDSLSLYRKAYRVRLNQEHPQ